MLKFLTPVAAASVLAIAAAMPAAAADIYEPPIIDMPSEPVVYKDDSFGGWYIRGDIGYRHSTMRGIDYFVYDPGPIRRGFETHKLRGSVSVGAGVGYQINHYLRTDFTVDYWGKTRFRGSTRGSGDCGADGVCVSRDTSSYSALLMLANAYAELGTYKRITPYVGAGVGGAYVKWDKLRNRYDTNFGEVDVSHSGAKGMRFAWALMAGASYCINSNLHADLGYRFTNISGGKMFGYRAGGGPGWNKAIQSHEVRAGLRYQFGGADNGCGETQKVVYSEPYEPISVPVYK